MAVKYETIPVFPKTKDAVDKYGKKSETYDDVINRLLKTAKADQNK